MCPRNDPPWVSFSRNKNLFLSVNIFLLLGFLKCLYENNGLLHFHNFSSLSLSWITLEYVRLKNSFQELCEDAENKIWQFQMNEIPVQQNFENFFGVRATNKWLLPRYLTTRICFHSQMSIGFIDRSDSLIRSPLTIPIPRFVNTFKNNSQQRLSSFNEAWNRNNLKWCADFEESYHPWTDFFVSPPSIPKWFHPSVFETKRSHLQKALLRPKLTVIGCPSHLLLRYPSKLEF